MSDYLEVYETIIERLKHESFLSEFQFKKSYEAFKRVDKYGWFEVGLYKSKIPSWWMKANDGYQVTTDFLLIEPTSRRRFNILSDWFSPFSLLDKKERTRVAHAYIDSSELDFDHDFVFSLDLSNYETEYNRLQNSVKTLTLRIVNDYSNLKQYYLNNIHPLFETPPNKYAHGVTWVFDYLFVTRLLYPEKYSELKDVLFQHLEALKERKEPNYEEYEPQIPEIISTLEREADKLRPKLEL